MVAPHIDHQAIAQHVRTLNDCNQRGGRMLSLVDLVDAGSMDSRMAGYMAAMMQQGSSLLVGARPGGAGKTAVMCACLNFLPVTTVIKVMEWGIKLKQMDSGSICYLAHEIGAGGYYAYVWGQHARDFFALSGMGAIIVSNLHADTPQETYDQLCAQNGIPRNPVQGVALKIYLRTARSQNGGTHRWVSHVYESEGDEDTLIWEGDGMGIFRRLMPSQLVNSSEEDIWCDFVTACREKGIRRIEDVRRMVYAHKE